MRTNSHTTCRITSDALFNTVIVLSVKLMLHPPAGTRTTALMLSDRGVVVPDAFCTTAVVPPTVALFVEASVS